MSVSRWSPCSDWLQRPCLYQQLEVTAEPCRQGACLYEDTELDVVVDAGAGEIGAGDERG